jgi:hypothetical protein
VLGGVYIPPQPVHLIRVAEFEVVNGQDCHIEVEINADAEPVALTLQAQVWSQIMEDLPVCPAGAVKPQPGAAPQVPTPAELAAAFWDQVRLPVPKPSCAPGFAITGKLIYLETGDTVTPAAWQRATPLGELTITAHGSTTVDWGDGSAPSGPYMTSGGPYPSGQITHTYDRVGPVTIEVRQAWTADWSIGGAHGVLTTLHTDGALPDFPVRQVQAVITG